ncbi:MAG: AIR synthase-related protein [Verrucomicrobiota bacterium]|nr:AIR synthase-related protein [Verrucomicrobiota bacterium]
MYFRTEVMIKETLEDPRGMKLITKIKDFLNIEIKNIRTADVYSIFADISEKEALAFADAVANPILQNVSLKETTDKSFDWIAIVGFAPGVTDNVGRTAQDALSDIINRKLTRKEKVYSSVEYFFSATNLSKQQMELIVSDILANELIETSIVMSRDEWLKNAAPINKPEVLSPVKPAVEEINLNLPNEELTQLSRNRTLALSLKEMQTIKDYFADSATAAERKKLDLYENATDVELEVLAQTWSEHCKHKIFAATIEYEDEKGNKQTIKSCYKSFIQKSTKELSEELDWLVSVFVDNAGVIAFNERLNLVYKVETHNSPSALDPYGGAMTGIVGVNRDPMGTGQGANLLFNVWGYCLGSPFTARESIQKGLLHPRRIRDGVHAGVIDGGNQSGIPYMNGWEYFDERYLGKPLVFCGTAGTLPVEINGLLSHTKKILPGDIIVMTGGRIGKDGIHGATFSSEELHEDSPVQAVQIGDPITQKKMSDFIYEARDKGLYRFVTDNGAGGLSSSIGEMAEECDGCDIDLGKAPLKYEGLHPWEIFVSEAQERMSFAVAPENLQEFKQLAIRRDVEASVLGTFNDSGKLTARYNGKIVAFLDLEFLHDGLPEMNLKALWKHPVYNEPVLPAEDISKTLCTLLSRLNICSNETKSRQYDHEVKGLSVIKPFVGLDRDIQSDATVAMVEHNSTEGVIMASGITPRYSDIDTYHMMASAIDIAARRTVAVGGNLSRVAGLDNFCWPDPVQSEKTPDGEYKLAQLVRANQAIYDYTKAFKIPLISGKDSMKNDSILQGEKISIPPTVLFSTIAKMDDIRKAVTLDAKKVGDLVCVIGTTKRELGGSEFYAMLGAVGNDVPTVDSKYALNIYSCISKATNKELLNSVHSPVFGGLGVGFAKVCAGGNLGMTVDINLIPKIENLSYEELLFSETNSRFIVTVHPDNLEKFQELTKDIPIAVVGKITKEMMLEFTDGEKSISKLNISSIKTAYKKTLKDLL